VLEECGESEGRERKELLNNLFKNDFQVYSPLPNSF